MTLKSEDGLTEIELRILQYQFPEIQCDWDANWLTLGVRVRTADRRWSATDSCLLTWEAQGLVNWLSDLTTANQQDGGIDFLEPALAFHLAESGKDTLQLLVALRYGLLPLERRDSGWEEMVIPMRISRSALREGVLELAEEIRRFPMRGAAAALRRDRARDHDGQ